MLRDGLSFRFPLSGKRGITLPCPDILPYARARWLWSKIVQLHHVVKEIFKYFFLFTEVTFAVLGKMSSLCKGLWCRCPQARPTQANSKSKAAGMHNVLLLQMSYPGLSAALTGPSRFWYPSDRLWAVWHFIEASASLKQTHRFQTKYLIFQRRRAKMLKIMFAAIGLYAEAV